MDDNDEPNLLDLMGVTREAIAAAAAGAENDMPGWGDAAYLALSRFGEIGQRFMIEEVRAHAEQNGLPCPRDGRAWGSVASRAAKDRIIKKAGYSASRNPCAHHRPTTLWEKRA